jgi:hypothetical protein
MVRNHPLLFIWLVSVVTATLAAALIIFSMTPFPPTWKILLILAAVSAAVACSLFAKRLTRYAQSAQLSQVLVISCMIVICAHIAFGLLITFLPQLRGNPDGGFLSMLFFGVLIVPIYTGLITVPLGLIAGYVVYRLMKRNNRANNKPTEA